MLVGDHGEDTLRGGAGHNSLNGGAGRDSMYGDEGSDLCFAQLSGRDVDRHVHGGSGGDIVFFSSLKAENISSEVDINYVDYGLVDAFKKCQGLSYRDLRSWAGPGSNGHEKWTLRQKR